MSHDVSFGVLLPHFDPAFDPDRLTSLATKIESLGFDSVWVRDRLYTPRHFDHGGITEDFFLEGLMTLSAISTRTENLTLGTSVVNPHRHPLKLSQNLGTLNYLAPGRVVCGIGAGSSRWQFEATGLPFERRGALVEEYIEILRRTFNDVSVDFEGEFYSFEDVTIDPRPGEQVPIWYGGLAPVAVRRAITHADGWVPGRMTLDMLDERLGYLRKLSSGHDRTVSLGYLSLFSIANSTEEALERLNLKGILDDMNEIHPKTYRSVSEVESSFIAGTPEECRSQIAAFADRDVELIILDMRHSFEEIERMVKLTGDTVLNHF